MKLTVALIRKMKKQLESVAVRGDIYLPMAEPHMTVDGVVTIGLCFMHPETFRDVFGETAYQELLTKPRIANPFSDS